MYIWQLLQYQPRLNVQVEQRRPGLREGPSSLMYCLFIYVKAPWIIFQWRKPFYLFIFFTSRILDIHTSSDSSTSRRRVSFAVSTDSIAGDLGLGHCHLGKARIARVGVIKLKVPPWRIGNLHASMRKRKQIFLLLKTLLHCFSSSHLPTQLPSNGQAALTNNLTQQRQLRVRCRNWVYLELNLQPYSCKATAATMERYIFAPILVKVDK